MRLRIETHPPLPPLKAWISPTPGLFGLGTRTINDLRKKIIKDFDLPDDIILQLDGFELVGRDSISDLLEKDDLIEVVLRSETVRLGKRKREDEEIESGVEEKKRQVVVEEEEGGRSVSEEESSSDEEEAVSHENDKASSDEDSSSSSSSEEESSSDERISSEDEQLTNFIKDKITKAKPSDSDAASSSSSSFSSSDSDSDSSTSSDSSIRPSPKKQLQKQPTKLNIPPGLGTTRTHLRNARKARVNRLKQLIEAGYLPQGSTLATLAAYDSELSFYRDPTPSVDTPNETAKDVLTARAAAEVKEESLVTKTPGKRIDVAAVSRFIKAGLVGNKAYDKEREEARLRGKEKVVNVTAAPAAFVPRAVKGKKANSTPSFVDTPDAVMAQFTEPLAMAESGEMEEGEVEMEEEEEEEEEEEDPLISGFYEQVTLATQNRQSKLPSTTTTNEKVSTSRGKCVIRAFECEPEWCGMVEVEEGEEVDSLEIDPPELPFVDSYRQKQKKAAKGPAKSATTSPTRLIETSAANGPPTATTAAKPISPIMQELSEHEILSLPKMEKPISGGVIHFKSMFLDPVRYEPVVAWRWGRITEVDGSEVTIDVLGPKYTNDEDEEAEDGEVEEGKVEITEQRFEWGELVDARQLVE